MPLIPCGCRLIKCTDTYDPSFADNLGVWWQVSCGCRLYPCVDEVTSHSPSPTSSRESLTAPVPLQSMVEHDTLQEHFPDAQQPDIDWPFYPDFVHDFNLTDNDNNAFESDIVDWRIHHRECGNLLDPNGICLYHRPLCSRQALEPDLLNCRSLQREVATTREQLRQVENERDDLKIQLQKLTEDDAWGESAADFRNGFHAKYRSSKEWSKLNNASPDRLDSEDAARRSSFNHGPVNDHQSPQSRWGRPLNHATFFARARDDSLGSKPSSCGCTSTTSADARPFAFHSVGPKGRKPFPVYDCKCCGWYRYRQRPECDYISLSDEPEACSCSTSGTTGSTTSDTSRTGTDPFATNQYHSNCSSTFWQDYISGSRCMQPHPRAPALHYHAYPCGYESHIPCPISGWNISRCSCRIGGVRIRPRSFSLPSTISRPAPYFQEHAPHYHTPPRMDSTRALRGTVLLRRLMLASYTILAALIGIVATTPVENVEVKRSGVFIGLVGLLAVSSWLMGRDIKGRMGRK